MVTHSHSWWCCKWTELISCKEFLGFEDGLHSSFNFWLEMFTMYALSNREGMWLIHMYREGKIDSLAWWWRVIYSFCFLSLLQRVLEWRIQPPASRELCLLRLSYSIDYLDILRKHSYFLYLSSKLSCIFLIIYWDGFDGF